MAHFPASAGAVVLTPARVRPLVTTVFHSSAITKPNAAARDVEMVFRTSAIENFFSSPMSTSGSRVPTSRRFLLRHDPDVLDTGCRILPAGVLLERLHHVPDGQQR